MIKAAGFSDIALAIRHRFARGTRLTLSFAAGDIMRNEIESCSLSLSLEKSKANTRFALIRSCFSRPSLSDGVELRDEFYMPVRIITRRMLRRTSEVFPKGLGAFLRFEMERQPSQTTHRKY